MNHTTIAVDLAKNVFEIEVSHEPGKISEQKRVNRARLVSFFCETAGGDWASRCLRVVSLLNQEDPKFRAPPWFSYRRT